MVFALADHSLAGSKALVHLAIHAPGMLGMRLQVVRASAELETVQGFSFEALSGFAVQEGPEDGCHVRCRPVRNRESRESIRGQERHEPRHPEPKPQEVVVREVCSRKPI